MAIDPHITRNNRLKASALVGFLKYMSKNWIQSAVNKMNQHGTVGSFSADAKRHHMGTEAFASHVLSDSHSSTVMKKKAQFAENVHK